MDILYLGNGFSPHWIGSNIPNNQNGWIEEDPKEEEEDPEEDPEEDDDDVMEMDDEAKVIDPLMDDGSNNPPPPNSEDEVTPPTSPVILDADGQSIPPIASFGQNFHFGETSSTANLLTGNSKAVRNVMSDLSGLKKLVKGLSDRYDEYEGSKFFKDKKVLEKELSADSFSLPLGLQVREPPTEPSVRPVPALHHDDPYVVTRDTTAATAAAVATFGIGGDDDTVPIDSQPYETMPPRKSTSGNPPPPIDIGYREPYDTRKLATLGMEAVTKKTWVEVKVTTTEEYYPPEQIQRMECELWNLRVKETDISSYTTCFNELMLLCPGMVPTKQKMVEAYIRGLSKNIKGEVTSSEPTTLNKAVQMAHNLMEQKVKAIPEREANNKKRKWENFQGGSSGGGNSNSNRNNNNYPNKYNYSNNRIRPKIPLGLFLFTIRVTWYEPIRLRGFAMWVWGYRITWGVGGISIGISRYSSLRWSLVLEYPQHEANAFVSYLFGTRRAPALSEQQYSPRNLGDDIGATPTRISESADGFIDGGGPIENVKTPCIETTPSEKEQSEGYLSALKSMLKEYNKGGNVSPIRMSFDEVADRTRDRTVVTGKEIGDADLKRPFKEAMETPLTRRIIEFASPEFKMPANIKLYDGTTDPEDHLSRFSSATNSGKWPMLVWCRMFQQTLDGSGRGWFENLSGGSIDGWVKLRQQFTTTFSTRRAYFRDPMKITKIVRKANETVVIFKERWTVETDFITGVLEVMKISSFMDTHKCPELAKQYSDKVPKTMDEMMARLDDFVRLEEAFASTKLPKVEASEALKKSACPIKDVLEEPLIIEAVMEGYLVRRVYVDQGASLEDEGPKRVDLTEQTLFNPAYPDQLVTIGVNLLEGYKNQVKTLLKKSMDIFAWEPADMTGIPRRIIKHSLNVNPLMKPVAQIRRVMASDRTQAVQMALDDEEKLAFYTDHGTYCYTKMSFGLKNTRATYQILVDMAFQSQIGRNLEAYVDDMVIKSNDEKVLISDITETFKNLRRIKMKLNPKKCSFGDITKENKDKYRRTESAKKAFQESKKFIVELPFLTTPVKEETPYMYLAAVTKAVSMVYLTERKGKQCPIYYVSKTLNEAERNYSPLEKLAMSLLNMSRRLRRNAIKGQVLADFLSEAPVGTPPEEFFRLPARAQNKDDIKKRTLFTDGASNIKGFGAGLVLICPSERSTDRKEVSAIVEEEEDKWMPPIIRCLAEGVWPEDKEGPKSENKPVCPRGRCALQERVFGAHVKVCGALQANYVIREIHMGSCGIHIGARSVVAKAIRQGVEASQNSNDFNHGSMAILPMRNGDPCLWKIKVRHRSHRLLHEMDRRKAVGQNHWEGRKEVCVRQHCVPIWTPSERRKVATKREAKYKTKMEQYYNQKVSLMSFKPDEYVYQSNEASRVEDQGKLRPKWEGPYRLTKAYQNDSYNVANNERKQSASDLARHQP
nr:reverse transcriptase domain-containing protein [Tanacetum cinerariifolium]